MTVYPTIEGAFAIHSRLIERFGGSHCIRALARPHSGYCRDLIEEAAALWESLSQDRPLSNF